MTMSNATVAIGTLWAGEDQQRGWGRMVNGASQGKTVRSAQTDFAIANTAGAIGDYLRAVRVSVNTSANSQVIVKDGISPTALISTLTVAAGSTASSIVTSTNAAAVTADQYKDCIIKVGTTYRRILTHGAFSGGTANTYTLDHALSATPANGTAIRIEDPQFVFELVAAASPVGPQTVIIDERCTGSGWFISTDTGVIARAVGSFT